MNSILLTLLGITLGIILGFIITTVTAIVFVYWNTLAKVLSPKKLYARNPKGSWMLEVMAEIGILPAKQRELAFMLFADYALKHMDLLKQCLQFNKIEFDTTPSPSLYSRAGHATDVYGNPRTIQITVRDNNQRFGVGFLIILSFLLIKELEMNKFNHSPLYIIFCSAEIFQNGECSDRSIGTNFNFNKDTNLNSFFTHFHKGVCELYQYTDDLSSIETFVTRVYPCPQK